MIKTLNPYSTTAEIMSRYRPLAPKPEVPANSTDEKSALSQKMKQCQSPYLRNLWPQLQARPTRTQKRGRATLSPPESKDPYSKPFFTYSWKPLFASCSKVLPSLPQPIRPVGSSIFVGCINEEPGMNPPPMQVPKKPEEIEDDVEAEALPAVISDSNNKVRLVNSAYNELVGQPECPWLDSMVKGTERRSISNACGEVTLNLFDLVLPLNSNGFSCWVRIEWGKEGNNKGSITTFCDVVRLSCQSKDYLFTWRFHIHNSEASHSSSNL
ncbi:hypothetical protein GQ457_16G015410 [Hibiscus cannabinus]